MVQPPGICFRLCEAFESCLFKISFFGIHEDTDIRYDLETLKGSSLVYIIVLA